MSPAPAPPLLLQTDRLTLRPLTLDLARPAASGDVALLEALLEARVPPEWPLPDLRAFLPRWVEMLRSDPDLARWGIWVIIHRDQGRVIGDVGFSGRPGRAGSVELGCGILPAHRCMGFGTEAAGALIDWAVELASLFTVFAEAEPGDAAARRMLTRLGFSLARPSRDRDLWKREV